MLKTMRLQPGWHLTMFLAGLMPACDEPSIEMVQITSIEGSRALNELNEAEQEQLCLDLRGILSTGYRCETNAVFQVQNNGGDMDDCMAQRDECIQRALGFPQAECMGEEPLFGDDCTATVDDWLACEIEQVSLVRASFAEVRCANFERLDDVAVQSAVQDYEARIAQSSCQRVRELCGSD